MVDIFAYWNNRNGSSAYSKKLFKMFVACGNRLVKFLLHGKLSPFAGVRSVLVKDYQLLYTDKPNELRVVTIFDTRQNPDKLEERLK